MTTRDSRFRHAARVRHTATLAFALVLAVGAVAFAQQAPSAPAQASGTDARDAFQHGITALDDGQFAVAAEAFENSYRLRPVPTVLLNLAIARRGQGRYRDAIAALERFVADPGPRSTPQTVTQARDEARQLRAMLGTLEIRREPATATVTVDGRTEPVQSDGTVALDPGSHVVEIASEGYVIDRRTLNVAERARMSLSVQLAPVGGTAHLQVVTNVPAASIRVDGAEQGRGQIDIAAAPGDHTLDVQAHGYATVRRTVHVGLTGSVHLDLALVRQGAPSWLVPVLVVAGVVVVGGVVVLTAYEVRGTTAPIAGTWGTVHE